MLGVVPEEEINVGGGGGGGGRFLSNLCGITSNFIGMAASSILEREEKG